MSKGVKYCEQERRACEQGQYLINQHPFKLTLKSQAENGSQGTESREASGTAKGGQYYTKAR